MRISEQEADTIVNRCIQSIAVRNIITRQPVSVSLAPVHTYVHQIGKKIGVGDKSILVPPFACHWGIVVTHPIVTQPNRQILYHLVFAPPNHDNKPFTVDNAHIQFRENPISTPLENMRHVGMTRYTRDELVILGDSMIKEFGNYHRLFWNCQTFAKCFLRVITGDINADFSEWTSADASRLFLCAFLVGVPLSTTTKIKEQARIEKLLEQFEQIPDGLDAEDRSNLAISAIYNVLANNPFWGEDMTPVPDESNSPRFLDRLFGYLFKRNQTPRN
jgi:hypothetical protein